MIHSPIKSSEGPPSEGEQKIREIVSPSEGGTGMLEWKMRLHRVLEAMLHLRTFGRWAENEENYLTFRR